MDLKILDKIVLDRKHGPAHVDVFDQQVIDDSFHMPQALPCGLYARNRGLVFTEEVEIPVDAIGMIVMRSTWVRLGLMSSPAFADPGFVGNLTIPVFNTKPVSILIPPNVKMFSMILLPMHSAYREPEYTGRYQGSQGIALPKALVREDG